MPFIIYRKDDFNILSQQILHNTFNLRVMWHSLIIAQSKSISSKFQLSISIHLDKISQPCTLSYDKVLPSLFYNVASHKVCNHYWLVVLFSDTCEHVAAELIVVVWGVSFRDLLYLDVVVDSGCLDYLDFEAVWYSK